MRCFFYRTIKLSTKKNLNINIQVFFCGMTNNYQSTKIIALLSFNSIVPDEILNVRTLSSSE